MLPTPSFNHILYRRARIVEDYGGDYAIPDEDEVVAPEQPGKMVRPRQEHIHEDPPPPTRDFN